MARKKEKAEEEEEEEEEEYADLEDVAEKVTISTGGKSFPLKLAEVLKAKVDRDGSFSVPKEWLEKKLGYDSSSPMKGRPNGFKRKLNKQHRDLLGDSEIWHVGNKDGKLYTIAIIEATPDEIKKWQE